jgi:hypothetical protein
VKVWDVDRLRVAYLDGARPDAVRAPRELRQDLRLGRLEPFRDEYVRERFLDGSE